MNKVFAYLKPYIFGIIIAAALLFLQVNMELTLPDYMSKIVNVGIQQGGIDNTLPEVIRKAEAEKILLFADEQTQAAFSAGYTLIDSNSAKYNDYIGKYPVLEQEALFILTDKAAATDAEKGLAKSMLIVSGIKMMADPEQSGNMSGNMQQMNQRLPDGVDLFTALSMMPEESANAIIEQIKSSIPEMDEMIVSQQAMLAIKAEYEAIGVDTALLQRNYILRTGGMMLLFTIIAVTATILSSMIAARIAAGMARNVRGDLFSKVEYFSGAEFDKFSTASLITRTTNDITQIQMLVFLMLRMVLYAPIMGAGGVIRALGKAPSMAWIIGLAVLILIVLVVIVFIVAMPKFRKIQTLVDRLNLVARENLSGLMVVRSFNRQKFELERFDTANKDLTKTNLFVMRVMVLMMPFIMLIMNMISVVIIWVGAKQVEASSMQVGDMMAFMQYSMQIVMSFLMLTMIFIFMPRAVVSARRVAEVLNTESSIHDPEHPKRLPEHVNGVVEFKDVCFRYPGAEEDALHHISFTAKPGKTTAIIGSTGCGKSTTVNLIPRFYDVTNGEITLDGINIKDITQEDLRSQLGYVPQKSTLFSGTISSNMRYADENATDDKLKEAAETAQAMEFINQKEQHFDEPISQGGANISGGQKQRLSIARALSRDYPVLIFDDSFSALDFKTDAALRKGLRTRPQKATIIIIAQRVSTIMNADQILVLDNGKIVGKGSHKELLKSCEAYQEIAQSQLESKELA